MKKLLTVFLICLINVFITFGQNESNVEQVPDSINLIGSKKIKKGDIFLKDGTSLSYKNLTLRNDSIFFTANKEPNYMPLSEVVSVTRKKSTVSNGAMVGGIIGLIGGLFAGIFANSDEPIEEIIGVFTDDPDDGYESRTEDLPYIGIGIAGGAALGALFGLAGNRSKVVYHMNSTVDVLPSIGFNQQHQNQYMLTLRINLGSK